MSDDNKEIVPTPRCLDKLGQNITVGSLVVYGSLLGRSAALRVGKVLKIRALKPHWSSRADQYDWRITVQGIDDDRWEMKVGKDGIARYTDERIVALCNKGTLLFVPRPHDCRECFADAVQVSAFVEWSRMC